MSKSLARVRSALHGLDCEIVEMSVETRTAAQAAEAVGCEVDQIAKSIIFRGETSGQAILFITAGGNQVNADAATRLAGERLGKADAGLIREQTGFAIGGVAPVGHLTPPRAFFDPRLSEFGLVWAAAGTPRHVFSIDPAELLAASGASVAEFTDTEKM